jgi:peptidoglycan L-alanyl-D-glutamate endopeptidase CwlK
MPKFGLRSKTNLATAHPDLRRVFNKVIESYDCSILEGKRSEIQQRENVASGVSKTLNSKHVYPLDSPSLAVDAAPYPVLWPNDNLSTTENEQRLKRFHVFAGFVLGVAHGMGITLKGGIDWDRDWDFADQRFHDLPHFELIP